jgi:hypothetical protein
MQSIFTSKAFTASEIVAGSERIASFSLTAACGEVCMQKKGGVASSMERDARLNRRIKSDEAK